MKGVPLITLFQAAGASDKATGVAFHSADGYYTTHAITDLLSYDAFMAYEINGQQILTSILSRRGRGGFAAL